MDVEFWTKTPYTIKLIFSADSIKKALKPYGVMQELLKYDQMIDNPVIMGLHIVNDINYTVIGDGGVKTHHLGYQISVSAYNQFQDI